MLCLTRNFGNKKLCLSFYSGLQIVKPVKSCEFVASMTMATTEMSALSRLPVVVVLGATGTGKSKLAVDLAAKFGGEIISADSMQVYKGLDILTNKVTEQEMKNVPHHMISIVKRSEKFEVTSFRDLTLPLVESILKNGKLPFLVGGTNYYIESVLWKVLMKEPKNLTIPDCEPDVNSRKRKHTEYVESDFANNEILSFASSREGNFEEKDLKWSSDALYEALKEIDPVRAMRLHPKDKRKVIRSIQIRFQTGRKHSDLIAEQCIPSEEIEEVNTTLTGHESDNDLATPSNTVLTKMLLGGSLRFPNCLCLWIQAPQEILDERIEKRVDEMIEKGLRKELDDHMDILRNENSELDFEEGQLQSIGFKEFNSYLQIPPDKRNSDEADKLFLEGIDRLKVVTKQYSRRQLKWIRTRFLRPDRRQVPPVYWLDGSLANKKDWDRNVTSVGESILEAYLLNKFDLPILKERRATSTDSNEFDDLITRKCEICDRIFVGKIQWDAHAKSAKHRKVLKRKQKMLKQMSSAPNSDEAKVGEVL